MKEGSLFRVEGVEDGGEALSYDYSAGVLLTVVVEEGGVGASKD